MQYRQKIVLALAILVLGTLGYVYGSAWLKSRPKNPIPNGLRRELPYLVEHFGVEVIKTSEGEKIQITLLATINRPDQWEQYKEDLAVYRIEAEEWLKGKGYDVDQLPIVWLPPD